MKNKFTTKLFLASAFCSFLLTNINAQGTLEDYNRAYSIKKTYSSKSVLYGNVQPKWVKDSHIFWYVRNTPNGMEYTKVDADKKSKTPLFNQEKLATLLSLKSGVKCEKYNLWLKDLTLDLKSNEIKFIFNNRNWTFQLSKNELTDKGEVPAPAKQPHWMVVDDEKGGAKVSSPDGKKIAYIKNDNVYVTEISTGKETQLSIDGTKGNYYSSYIQWSPDSKCVTSCKIRPAEKRFVYYVESSPTDQLQPKLHKQEYAKPGDELRFKVPCIFNVDTKERIIPSTELFDNQYDIQSVRWNKDSKALTFEFNQRGHKIYRLLELSATSGKVRTVIEEKQDKYVDYQLIYCNHLSDDRHIIWASERDNYNHLYLFDRVTGKLVNKITKGDYYVRGVQKVDEANKQIYFSANGVNKNEDPYFIHFYKINFDGTNLVELTPNDGMHQCWYSSDYKYLVDVYSKVDVAPTAVVRCAKTSKLCMNLEKADISKLISDGWRAPESFVAKGRDGKTDIWGIIYRPSNFDSNKKYPVIEYIYSGPGGHFVPKSFASYNGWMSSIAELGFIVVQVDGMSTSFRTKKFEEVCYKNLKDAGLPDHILWIKAAAKKYPYMDADNVGIFGCSAGGQESTAAVLFHPEFYKAAYSACGCHDNRMDKIWWNELWMGYPIDKSYSECSNVDNAYRLTRPLMLVVGEIDDNVDPASTMQVANALIKANKEFELVVIPGAYHTMGEAYGEHKRFDFFVRQLYKKEPPKWSDVKVK